MAANERGLLWESGQDETSQGSVADTELCTATTDSVERDVASKVVPGGTESYSSRNGLSERVSDQRAKGNGEGGAGRLWKTGTKRQN